MTPAPAADVTIYHNPACGTSRNVLALLQASGASPSVIEYLKTPPDAATLAALLGRAGLRPRDAVRTRGVAADVVAQLTPSLDDARLLSLMAVQPALINRPLVVTAAGVDLCRPSDRVIPLLPQRPAKNLCKDDGSPFLVEQPLQADDAGMAAALAAAGLPVDDLGEPGRTFLAYDTLDGTRVGYGGFELLGTDALLRSIVVLEAARGRGVGGGILGLLLRRAFDQGARQAWLLTTSAADWFEQRGFKRMERVQAPPAVLATRQASALCPASAALLARAIEL